MKSVLTSIIYFKASEFGYSDQGVWWMYTNLALSHSFSLWRNLFNNLFFLKINDLVSLTIGPFPEVFLEKVWGVIRIRVDEMGHLLSLTIQILEKVPVPFNCCHTLRNCIFGLILVLDRSLYLRRRLLNWLIIMNLMIDLFQWSKLCIRWGTIA